MDGMLSQDEINALLNGVDLSADDKGSAAATTATVGQILSLYVLTGGRNISFRNPKTSSRRHNSWQIREQI